MAQTLGHVTLVVRDYDEAIAFFTHALGFKVIKDIVLGEGKRWILVGPPHSQGTSLLLAQASTPEEVSHIGTRPEGESFFFCIPTISGVTTEARESVKLKPASPGLRRDVLEVCFGLRPPSDFDRNVREVEREAITVLDPEPKYESGAVLSFCGQKESALRLLKRAIEQNYCAYSALQQDPLLEKLRGTPEFKQLLAAAKECQSRFLATTKQDNVQQ